MALRKRTLRRMQPFTRKLAKLYNEADALRRHIKTLVDEVQEMELKARALDNMQSDNE